MADRPPLDIAALRREYRLAGLDETDVVADPIEQFSAWLDEALAAGIPEPTAMVLATADAQGRPTTRTVLLKQVDARGFVFFTNRRSRKGRQLHDNSAVALTFPWIAMARQVAVVGEATQVDADESDAYFASRPRPSQLAAWASTQSDVAASRAAVDAAMAEIEQRFGDGPVPRPEHWGGYLVRPVEIEFWQGRENRLHDRLRYRRSNGGWSVHRLWP